MQIELLHSNASMSCSVLATPLKRARQKELVLKFLIIALCTLSAVSAIASEIIHDVTMGESKVTLHLPESWIDSIAGARLDGQVLLHMRWPKLSGYYDGHERDYPKNLPAYGNMVRILLTLSDRINSLQDRYQRNLTLHPSVLLRKSTLGLEQWEQTAPDKLLSGHKSEIYFFAYKNDHIETYLDCDIPGIQPYPGCHAEFYIGSFLARVSYSRIFLPEWKTIQEKVSEMVLSAT